MIWQLVMLLLKPATLDAWGKTVKFLEENLK